MEFALDPMDESDYDKNVKKYCSLLNGNVKDGVPGARLLSQSAYVSCFFCGMGFIRSMWPTRYAGWIPVFELRLRSCKMGWIMALPTSLFSGGTISGRSQGLRR